MVWQDPDQETPLPGLRDQADRRRQEPYGLAVCIELDRLSLMPPSSSRVREGRHGGRRAVEVSRTARLELVVQSSPTFGDRGIARSLATGDRWSKLKHVGVDVLVDRGPHGA